MPSEAITLYILGFKFTYEAIQNGITVSLSEIQNNQEKE